MTKGLSSRWSARSRHTPAFPAKDGQHTGDLCTPLPPPLARAEIARLFHSPDPHELESLLADAVRHTATLKQLRSRSRDLMRGPPAGAHQHVDAGAEAGEGDHSMFGSLPSLSEFFYAFEVWHTRMKTLEMIAAARSSLRTLKEPEETAVRRARVQLSRTSTSEGS